MIGSGRSIFRAQPESSTYSQLSSSTERREHFNGSVDVVKSGDVT